MQRFSYFLYCRRPESNRYGYHYPRDFKSRASASSATAAYRNKKCSEWMEVDSNHRSNLQQIYSLSPLATRESIHLLKFISSNKIVLYFISKKKARGFLKKIEKNLIRFQRNIKIRISIYFSYFTVVILTVSW